MYELHYFVLNRRLLPKMKEMVANLYSMNSGNYQYGKELGVSPPLLLPMFLSLSPLLPYTTELFSANLRIQTYLYSVWRLDFSSKSCPGSSKFKEYSSK